MVPKTVDGVPAHPLIIHIPVMLGPLVGLLCVLMLVPRFRAKLAPATAVLGVLFAISAIVAVMSGENLLKVLQLGDAIEKHQEAGELLRTMAVGLAFVLVAFAFAVRKLSPRLVTVGAVIVAALGVVETAQVVRTGHEGASLVWKAQYDSALKAQ